MRNNAKISLKKVNFPDIEFLWYLRNQPDIHKYFRDNRPISWEKHIQWILPIILGLSNKEIFLIRIRKVPIGQVRFDYQNKNDAEVSISIYNKFQGKGFAKEALSLAIKKFKNRKGIRKLTAEINKKNLSSIKLFEKFGFKLKNKRDKWLIYERKIN